MYCLDSNIAIALLRGGRDDVEERLARTFERRVAVALPTIVLMELRFGVYRARRMKDAMAVLDNFLKAPFQILSFSGEDANCAAELRAALASTGKEIGPYDSLIAAQALSRGMTLVTNNIRAFSRIPGLKLDDWLAP